MGKKKLLDCTLRDGGYVNDWEFGHNNLVSIFERLVDSKVDIIEVGFLDDRRPYDYNRSIMPDTEAIGKNFGEITKRPPMVVGMIDFGTCAIENLQPCEESFLDGIRVIFKKQKMHAAMEYCAQVKALGYKVFSQLVSITSYSDQDLMQIIELVNQVEPYAVSMVDTYGLLDSTKMLHYYELLDQYVKPGIQIGFHPHNNFQLAYANAVAFLNKPTERDILVDGTLFGMGKSAGNAPLELISMYMREQYGLDYDTRPMLEAIEESIKPFYTKTPWGYKTFFYLCASNECHPSYVEFFQKKGNLSVSKLDELLARIEPEEKKLLYDKELAEKIYQEFISEQLPEAEEYQRLSREFSGKELLLIGPGRNIQLQLEKVKKYIEKKRPFVVSVNYIPKDITVDYVFVTKGNRYQEMTTALHNQPIKIIATSNLTCKNGKFDFMVNREPLLEQKEEIKDNSFLMLLKVLKKCGITRLACAGFDGYSDKEDNYFLPGMEYSFVKQAADHLNHHIKSVLTSEYGDMDIEYITFSRYDVEEDVNSAAF